MNTEEAKKILALFRPGTPDRMDPAFTEALQQTRPAQPPGRWQDKGDPEMADWFQKHCSSYVSVRRKFQTIPVPAALKDQIISEFKPAKQKVVPFPAPAWLAIAAIVVLSLCLGMLYLKGHGGHDDFLTFRTRMARTALQPYSMELSSHDPRAVKSYLAERSAPADFVLPRGTAKAQLVGCTVVRWQGQPVSMVCFKSGAPLAAGMSTDLWLFIADTDSVKNAPKSDLPELARVMLLSTATWTREGKTYILATTGDDAFLQRFL